MTQFVRDTMDEASRGYTRDEVHEILLKIPAFAERLRKNPICFQGIFSRLVEREEIREVDGRYYSGKVPKRQGKME